MSGKLEGSTNISPKTIPTESASQASQRGSGKQCYMMIITYDAEWKQETGL
jgi:hypothetical protein